MQFSLFNNFQSSHEHPGNLIQPHTASSNSEGIKQRFCFLLIKTPRNRDNFMSAMLFWKKIETHFYSQCLMWNCWSTKMNALFFQSHVRGPKRLQWTSTMPFTAGACIEMLRPCFKAYCTLNATTLILHCWKQWKILCWFCWGLDWSLNYLHIQYV